MHNGILIQLRGNKEMALSVKSIIENGIRENKTVVAILKIVAKKMPNSVADDSHVRYYANRLVKSGEITTEVAQKRYGCSGGRGRKKTVEVKKVKKTKADVSTAKKSPVRKVKRPTMPSKESEPVKKTKRKVVLKKRLKNLRVKT